MAGFKKIPHDKVRTRLRRKGAIRKKIRGTAARPRLSVFRSLKHIYAQAIDDDTGKVLAAASDLDKEVRAEVADKKKKERAKAVGEKIGKLLVAQKVASVVFDRNGYIFHGRVKEVADGARAAGLKF